MINLKYIFQLSGWEKITNQKTKSNRFTREFLGKNPKNLGYVDFPIVLLLRINIAPLKWKPLKLMTKFLYF